MTEPLLRWLDGTTGAGLASALAHLTWQGALVGLAALVALRLAGRASAARCRVAMAALALLALAPAATLARRGGWLARASTGLVALAPEGTQHTPEASAPRIGARVGDRQMRDAASPAGAGDRLARTWRAARPWLLLVWLVGVLLSFARLAGGIARLRGFRRRSTPAPPPVTRDVERLARRLGITHRTDVRVSGDVGIPLTFGALWPVVLLPRRLADDLRPDRLRLVMAHELAHVARRDYAVNLAQCVVEAFLFFHPVVHWLSRTLREEREHCCDERAASVARDRRAVARALVALEELVGKRSACTLAPAATGGILLRRIERLVATATPPRRLHTMLSLGVLVIAVALVVLATPASAGVERLADGFSVVWAGGVGPGERLRVRNLVGSIRVVPVAGNRATIRARLSGGVLSDLVFEPTRDAEGPTVCALRGAYGRCDAEGYTWLGTRDEMYRARIDLVVELPLGASITAASFEGDLVLDGVGGDAEARTGLGAITARVASARGDRTLEFHTGAGEVRVALPRDFGGTLQARLSDGTVEHEMPLTPIGEFSPQRMRASLGPGGNRLRTSSGQGSLVLTRTT